jgi:hypothetical protein
VRPPEFRDFRFERARHGVLFHACCTHPPAPLGDTQSFGQNGFTKREFVIKLTGEGE